MCLGDLVHVCLPPPPPLDEGAVEGEQYPSEDPLLGTGEAYIESVLISEVSCGPTS